jgi:hypothetical protein
MAFIASSIDLTIGLSDEVDVALFATVELVEFDIADCIVEFVWPYETTPFEIKIMEIVASPSIKDCIDLFFMTGV